MRLDAKFTALLLFFLDSTALAQEASFPELPGCDRLNSSRLPAPECGYTNRPPVVIRHELDVTTKISLPEIRSAGCKAEISVEYLQRNTFARVDATIQNHSCAASAGSFEVSIRTRDEGGELKTQAFLESWMREDDQPVTFSEDYEIGVNADLVLVRVAKVRCTCESEK